MDRPRTPVVGTVDSQSGFKVRVRAATLRQSLDLQAANAAGDEASLKALADFVGAVAEIDGEDDPAAVLTAADCAKVVRLAANGGGADFP